MIDSLIEFAKGYLASWSGPTITLLIGLIGVFWHLLKTEQKLDQIIEQRENKASPEPLEDRGDYLG